MADVDRFSSLFKDSLRQCLFTLFATVTHIFPRSLRSEAAEDVVDETLSTSVLHQCASCMNLIEENEYLEALAKEWHLDCFR